jgi:hypothetical protein
MERRQFLAAAAAGTTWITGCGTSREETPAGGASGTRDTARPERETTGEPTGIDGSGGDGGDDGEGTETPGATPAGGGLDLREANVVGVEVAERDGSYRFSVALHHDDAGEAGYADWWQVERLDGRRLGRRVLAHPHTRQPFERSATIDVPPGVACVVVRGHDQTHGYGGRAVIVSLETGARTVVEQGPERKSLTDRECP